ncbi:hypothetical protein J6590_059924, partial [Homalodisca vitripennis]
DLFYGLSISESMSHTDAGIWGTSNLLGINQRFNTGTYKKGRDCQCSAMRYESEVQNLDTNHLQIMLDQVIF